MWKGKKIKVITEIKGIKVENDRMWRCLQLSKMRGLAQTILNLVSYKKETGRRYFGNYWSKSAPFFSQ